MDIQEHLNSFINEEIDEAVDKLHDDGIIYETVEVEGGEEIKYHFIFKHIMRYHFSYIEERLIEAGFEGEIDSVADFFHDKGEMFAIYNKSKLSYGEARELLIRRYNRYCFKE